MDQHNATASRKRRIVDKTIDTAPSANDHGEAWDPTAPQPWYLAPRLPHFGDDPQYQFWCQLALDYEQVLKSLLNQHAGSSQTGDQNLADQLLQRDFGLGLDKQSDPALFFQTALPVFEQLLAARKVTIEMVFLWGRLCMAAAGMLSGSMSKIGSPQLSAVALERRGPLKWYLLWRNHYRRLGLTMHRANKDFLEVAFAIATGSMPPPKGFAAAWFCGAVCQGKNREPVNNLPHAFKRVKRLAYCEQLLNSPPDRAPAVPPVGLGAYRRG